MKKMKTHTQVRCAELSDVIHDPNLGVFDMSSYIVKGALKTIE